LTGAVGGRVPDEPEPLREVVNLVEQPVGLRGRFNSDFLALPKDVLITVMKKHQRYFPILDGEGNLMPYFITFANSRHMDPDTVRHDNEAVIRARFSDAEFFYTADRRRELADFLPDLATLTFQEDLGSMLDKTERLEALVPKLASVRALAPEEQAVAERAARLAKADLATDMVVEFTDLQGVMGQEYALSSGEDAAVAQAIFEHYLPRGASDELPKSAPGTVVGLADRLDSLVGLFAVGMQPTGSADPFGLRRAALGLIQILIQGQIDLDLPAAIRDAAEGQPMEVSAETQQAVLEFVRRRLQGVLLETGYRHDVVEAVLAEQGDNPYRAAKTVRSLSRWVERSDWGRLLTAYSRTARIVKGVEHYELNPEALEAEASRHLFHAYQQAIVQLDGKCDIDAVLAAFEPLTEPIDRFFDDVLVMVDDAAVRENRLALLQRVTGLTAGVVDLSKLQGF
jgi:glycyl-tRNA synthetase